MKTQTLLALAGAGVLSVAATAPFAVADSLDGVLAGVTSSVRCTAQGDAVVTFSYPGGLPAGTGAFSNADYFKYAPVTAEVSLGTTSGTVTFPAAALSAATAYNDVISAGLATGDARVYQAPGFAPSICGGDGGHQGGDRAGVEPTVSFGAAYCRSGRAYTRVATGNPDDEPRNFTAASWLPTSMTTGTVTAPPGTHVQEVEVRPSAVGAPLAVGQVDLSLRDDQDMRIFASASLTLPDCAAAIPAPAISFQVAGWNCTTLVPSLTYRNESGEEHTVRVREGGVDSGMTLNVPAGVTTHETAPGLDGRTLAFVDARSNRTLSTISFDSSAYCAKPAPSSPSAPTSPQPSTPSTPTGEPSTPTPAPTSPTTSPTTSPSSTHPPAPGAGPTAGGTGAAPAPAATSTGGASGPLVQTDGVAGSETGLLGAFALGVGALAAWGAARLRSHR